MIEDEITESNCTDALVKAIRVFKASDPSLGGFKATLHDGSRLSIKFKWGKRQLANLAKKERCIMCRKNYGSEVIPESDNQLACLVCACQAGFAAKDA